MPGHRIVWAPCGGRGGGWPAGRWSMDRRIPHRPCPVPAWAAGRSEGDHPRVQSTRQHKAIFQIRLKNDWSDKPAAVAQVNPAWPTFPIYKSLIPGLSC